MNSPLACDDQVITAIEMKMDISLSVATDLRPNNGRRDLTSGLCVVVILGSTATGKTALSIALARDLGGEIVNADSRYLYRGMDIGTAKPTEHERDGIPHHLIDIREPTETYGLATFLTDAYAAIEEVGHRGKLPVVTGGTPQYLRALTEGWQVPEVEPDWKLRERLEQQPASELFEQLRQIDPETSLRVDPANKRRLIRAIEVYERTGQPLSAIAGQSPPSYQFFIVGLRQERDILYPRIDRRVRDMYAEGWLDEVRCLRERGVTRDMPSMSAHGYREALDVVEGRLEIEEAIRRTQVMIHRYVRHQSTWFRKFPGIHWYDSSIPGYEQQVIADARASLASGSERQEREWLQGSASP